MVGVDGGPDENPRFHNNINMGCKTMIDFNLDCYIEVTNAPGLSAYNRAERRMYHLSKELTGVVLPYDTFGTHIVNGATVDTDLEIKTSKPQERSWPRFGIILLLTIILLKLSLYQNQ